MMNRLVKVLRRAACLMAAASALWLTGCQENVDTSNRYVFTKQTIVSYLEKHEVYSEYLDLLGKVKVSPKSNSTVRQLLTARGSYTCFAPTNEAIYSYLDSLVAKGLISEPSWDSFTSEKVRDSVYKVIVFNSIIDGGDFDYDGARVMYETGAMPYNPNEEIASPTMADRKLSVLRGNNPDSILINKTLRMSPKNKDIPAINGVIHQMEDVIAPGNDALSAVLQSYIDTQKDGFQVMARLVFACGLGDTLSKLRDETYELLYQTGYFENLFKHPTEGSQGYVPRHRKYGFTIFAEPDEFWREELGKEPKDITPEDVMAYLDAKGVYPEATRDDKYRSEKNLLNSLSPTICCLSVCLWISWCCTTMSEVMTPSCVSLPCVCTSFTPPWASAAC